jgi:CubicO group peptidase (beta-lactamase class C family)
MRVSSSIRTTLDDAVARGVFPGAVLGFRRGGGPPAFVASGHLSDQAADGPVSADTVYDLASLTKPLATVTALTLLIQDGSCRIQDELQRFLPEAREAVVGRASLADLLTHSSGLPGWRPLYERLNPGAALRATPDARAHAAHRALELILSEAPVYERGSKSLYSDLGFLLLGFVAERVAGMPLDRLVRERITAPLCATPLQYLPSDELGRLESRIAPTGYDAWRSRSLRGEVHDENAAALGGVAGHAGLFGTAAAVLAVTGAWLNAWTDKPSVLQHDLVRVLTARRGVPGSSWALGWDTPSAPSTSGRYFSARSFGHLGYTGTSIWIDPEAELEVVLLSNRVYPTRKNELIKEFRPVIHDLVYQETVGKA